MYSGRQPSGSISKCLILVALCIFHAAERVETTQHECSDEVVDCDNDMSICTEPEFNDFANANCKATCGRCAPSSSTTSTISSSTKTTTTPTSTTVTTELTTTKPTTTVATTVITTTTEKVTTQPTTTKRGIGADLRCTQFDGVKFVYSRSAFSCDNIMSDMACSTFFPANLFPGSGNDNPRPDRCYSLHDVATSQCPKTCAYCCVSAPAVPAPAPVPFPVPVPVPGPGPAPPPVPHPVPAPCRSYRPDTHYNCGNFKKNGFCGPNSHYTHEQKVQFCATTCQVC